MMMMIGRRAGGGSRFCRASDTVGVSGKADVELSMRCVRCAGSGVRRHATQRNGLCIVKWIFLVDRGDTASQRTQLFAGGSGRQHEQCPHPVQMQTHAYTEKPPEQRSFHVVLYVITIWSIRIPRAPSHPRSAPLNSLGAPPSSHAACALHYS